MLRDVEPGDLDAYLRLRGDPAMMRELGGPQSRERIAGQLERDLQTARDGTARIKMLVIDGSLVVAGTVTLYRHEDMSEIGWMAFPEFQGKGMPSAPVSDVLDMTRVDARWGRIHAFPSRANAAFNAICRSRGFTLLGEEETPFAGRLFRTNHWVIDPSDLASPSEHSRAAPVTERRDTAGAAPVHLGRCLDCHYMTVAGAGRVRTVHAAPPKSRWVRAQYEPYVAQHAVGLFTVEVLVEQVAWSTALT